MFIKFILNKPYKHIIRGYEFMQPLILIAVGYITGCIWGLYFKGSIVPIVFLPIFIFCFIKYKEKIKKYKKFLILFIICIAIGGIRASFEEHKFNTLYENVEKAKVVRNCCK